MSAAHALRAWVVSAVVASLAACTLGPDFKRPDPPGADRYTTKPVDLPSAGSGDDPAQQIVLGESLDEAWWRTFRSEELNGVVRRALDKNRTIAAASYALAEAQEYVAARAGVAAPQVGAGAAVGRQKFGREAVGDGPAGPAFTYFSVGPTVSYALDYTGRVGRIVERQSALAEFRRQQLAAAYLAVSGSAVLESLKIAALKGQIDSLRGLLEQDRENLRLVREAFAAGSVSRLDIVSAQSQLAADSALLPPLEQEVSRAQHALAIVLGQTPAEAGLPEFNLAKMALPRRLPVSLPSELAHRRPDILAAEAELHAATAAVGVATANLYPRIDLGATYALQAGNVGHLFGGGNDGWSLVGGLTAPLLDGGTLKAEQRAAVDAMLGAEARYQHTVLTAFGQVADALRALEHDAQALAALTDAERAARETLDLTRRSYREGAVGVLQVLDAQRRYLQARLGYVKTRAQRYMDTVQLFLALGGNGPEAATGTDAPRSDRDAGAVPGRQAGAPAHRAVGVP
jgi:NodT family efflux transporter outer membrane factor (OMF) lipoprotein